MVTVIGITQPPPRDGAWSALFNNLSKSKSGFDNYVEQGQYKTPIPFNPN